MPIEKLIVYYEESVVYCSRCKPGFYPITAAYPNPTRCSPRTCSYLIADNDEYGRNLTEVYSCKQCLTEEEQLQITRGDFLIESVERAWLEFKFKRHIMRQSRAASNQPQGLHSPWV
jgi:hypothetical protein